MTQLIDPDDRTYVDAIDDVQQRAVVVDSLSRYRAPEQLKVGDSVPPLMLTRLEPYGEVALHTVLAERPAVLVFGSYT